jgi:hypothetical protein
MFNHVVGRVYLFHSAPPAEFPFVDIPLFTQPLDTPTSLLVQLDDNDLSPESRNRLATVRDQSILSIEVIRENRGIDPVGQIAIAKRIRDDPRFYRQQLVWSG